MVNNTHHFTIVWDWAWNISNALVTDDIDLLLWKQTAAQDPDHFLITMAQKWYLVLILKDARQFPEALEKVLVMSQIANSKSEEQRDHIYRKLNNLARVHDG